jgi:hypothetical protein
MFIVLAVDRAVAIAIPCPVNKGGKDAPEN